VHDLLLLNTSPIPCVVTKERGAPVPRHPGVHDRATLRDPALLRGDGRRREGALHAVQLAQGADMWSPRGDW